MIVEARNLRKAYGAVRAVDGLSLEVKEGEIYGLLGPNGSGKTTTILVLLGLTEPTGGEVQVCGFNPTREPIKVADRPVYTYSRGMIQRLGIADVLVKEPRLAILDEPTTGIDPEGASQILDMIVKMRIERGMTILLSSHLLHQVQRVCDRVGIMHRGRLVAEGTMDELGAKASGEGLEFEARVAEAGLELVSALEGLAGVKQVEVQNGCLLIRCTQDVRGAIARTIVEHGAELLELRRRAFTLEEIYLRYFHG